MVWVCLVVYVHVSDHGKNRTSSGVPACLVNLSFLGIFIYMNNSATVVMWWFENTV